MSGGTYPFLESKRILFISTASDFRGSYLNVATLKIVLWNIFYNTLNLIDTFLKIGQFIHKIISFYSVQFGINLAPNGKLLRLWVMSHGLILLRTVAKTHHTSEYWISHGKISGPFHICFYIFSYDLTLFFEYALFRDPWIPEKLQMYGKME